MVEREIEASPLRNIQSRFIPSQLNCVQMRPTLAFKHFSEAEFFPKSGRRTERAGGLRGSQIELIFFKEELAQHYLADPTCLLD
jgi:hypothetical protein